MVAAPTELYYPPIKHLLKTLLTILFLVIATPLWASDLDTIEVTLIRQVDATLNGSGVPVAQAEAIISANDFEVNPAAVGQPSSLFTWISSNGTASTFPNSVGLESGHADAVGANFYGTSSGVAPGVSHVDNYEADYFYNAVVGNLAPPTIAARIVNQSFLFNSEVASVDQNYDDYAAQNNTIFVSAGGNGGPVVSPGTAFNSIDVGVYGSSSSVGPTTDGRCKPDITAPGGATSFSAPYVSGSAAILVQAATRGDGGANTSAATELRTIKALLLNGAVKPTDWTNSPAHPLDLRYGAGILNVFNSWHQLTGGQQPMVEATSVSNGSAHPPGSNTNNVFTYGWDFTSITNSKSGANYLDRIHHYYFNVPPSTGNSFALTATLVWNRAAGQSSISDLDLFLYNATTGTLICSSTSSVDNVEHIFQTKLPIGRYDLQVLRNGANVNASTKTETYALAFEAFNVKVDIARTNNNLVLSWPIAPAGFVLQSTATLTTPSWASITTGISITNSRNVLAVATANTQRFFRLQRP